MLWLGSCLVFCFFFRVFRWVFLQGFERFRVMSMIQMRSDLTYVDSGSVEFRALSKYRFGTLA